MQNKLIYFRWVQSSSGESSCLHLGPSRRYMGSTFFCGNFGRGKSLRMGLLPLGERSKILLHLDQAPTGRKHIGFKHKMNICLFLYSFVTFQIFFLFLSVLFVFEREQGRGRHRGSKAGSALTAVSPMRGSNSQTVRS